MWNYSFLFPSLLMLATILFFYLTRPRLAIRINRMYLSMLTLELLIIAFDIVSSVADETPGMTSTPMLYLLNTAFFVLYLARAYGFFRFSAEVLQLRNRRWLALASLPFAACEAVTLSSFATGAVFGIIDGAYHSGPMYGMLYCCYLFYIVLSFALPLARRGFLRRHQLVGYLAYNIMLLAGIVIRKIFPQLLVMNTFSLVSLLIIYLTFQNPDLFLSDRGPAFNMRGFSAMLNEVLQRRDYRILGFAVENYIRERGIYGGAQMDQGIIQVSAFLLESFPDCMAFYLRGGRFALAGSDRLPWELIRDKISERFQQQWVGNSGGVYLRIGFAEIKPQPKLDSVDRIVSNLSLALEMVGQPEVTAAKGAVLTSESVQQLDEQVDILRTLEQVIDRGEVEVFLQPVFDSRERVIVAAEALARIRDDEGRIIPPSLFIPIAEKNGYIDRLGEIVFEKTCAFIRDHDMAALNLSWINVNLSPIQCMQRDLTKRLTDILGRYGVPAEMLHLEITEQSIIDYSLLEEQINGLRDADFQFVLDDYGSGYSNLTRVKHYPFVNIKLDMEVVWDYYRERDSLLPNIVQAFKQMGFSITAEGIESGEMADALTEVGCDYLQGFLFDRPLPPEEFTAKYARK